MIWALLKRVFFRFDAETAHLWVVRLLRLTHRVFPVGLRLVARPAPLSTEVSSRWKERGAGGIAGLHVIHPLGLAAGFDKNADLLEVLPSLGFSFAEIGTVTPRPQAGNPRPRLFREPATQSLFNRMGFNNDGASIIAERVRHKRERLPGWFRVGINVGKNKDTPNEDAHRDYRAAIKPFRDLADYVVINVSSPNTPGLRELQTVRALKPIVDEVRDELAHSKQIPPLFLKLAPEMQQNLEMLRAILSETPKWGIKGFVLSNTLSGTWKDDLPGGYSGQSVQTRSRQMLEGCRMLTSLPLISVGGIDSAGEAMTRMSLGANLLQIYSGWIFRGPGLTREIVSAWARSVAN